MDGWEINDLCHISRRTCAKLSVCLRIVGSEWEWERKVKEAIEGADQKVSKFLSILFTFD